MALLALAVFLLVVLPLATDSMPRAEFGADVGPKGWWGRWVWHLLVALLIALMTISLYDVMSLAVQWGLWVQLDRRKFDQVFGDDASDRCRDGQLWLEVSTVASVLEEYGAYWFMKRRIEKQPSCRLYKAREWVSRHDALAARSLNLFFRDLGLVSPRVVTDESEVHEEAAPFVIYMGLTKQTGAFLDRATKGWLHRVRDPAIGDTVILLEKLLPNQFTGLSCEPVEASPERGTFCRLMPNCWNLTKWLGRQADDYALILRHTDKVNGRREVKVVVAGFTELGTAAAAEYLAKNWEKLWRNHVRRRWHGRGRGDFLLLLRGPSHQKRFADWEPVPDMRPVTPERLEEVDPHLDTPWVQRMLKADDA